MKKAMIRTLALSAVALAFSSNANNIAIDQVTKDVTYLAADNMNGRASFSPEIDQAANYIASRFKQAGLIPAPGESSFLQTFSAYQISPQSLNVSLNKREIEAANLTIATSLETVNWQSTDGLAITYISAEQDFRQVMRDVNQTAQHALVIASPAHKAMFERYKAFFDRGSTKLELNNPHALVVVLADDNQVNDLSVQASMAIKPMQLTNVVGVLPGQAKANEYILFSAHYDHIGTKPSNDGDVIFNGADDDASGTTAVMNLADFYSKQKDNARSVMFAAFTAEEIGGFGSKHFSSKLDADKVIAMINMEMIGKPSKFGPGTFWMTGFDRSNLAEIMNKNLAEQAMQVHADPYPEQNLFYRSDNATLARLGVPAHSVSSTQLDKDEHYHQVSDDVASLDLQSMTKVINAIATASQSLVAGQDTPSRIDASKVNQSGVFY